jgi:hypothetical protein
MTSNRFKNAQPSRAVRSVCAPAAHNSRTCKARALLAAGLTALLLAACAAPNPGVSAARSAGASSAVKPGEARTYAEPALIGKVIDQTTLKPIAGVFVYGHYMTTGGTLAGGSVAQEYLRNFVVETDSEGVFKLEAWSTGERKIAGTASDRFPMLAIWKPGYEPEFLGLASIAQYQPRVYMQTSVGADGRLWVTDPYGKTYRYEKVEPDTATIPNTIDWRATGFMLNPVKDELARYNALTNSGRAMVMFGECGWEPYAKVLLAQHLEWKEFLTINIPPEHLDRNGYSKGTYNHPDLTIRAEQSNRSTVQQLIQKFEKDATTWTCVNPKNVFESNR